MVHSRSVFHSENMTNLLAHLLIYSLTSVKVRGLGEKRKGPYGSVSRTPSPHPRPTPKGGRILPDFRDYPKKPEEVSSSHSEPLSSWSRWTGGPRPGE